jgi:hypothetical protein
VLKRVLLTAAALAAAVVVYSAFSLPFRRAELPALVDASVRGAIHIHSSRSDGRSSPDAIAEAAAAAGLEFIVLTDHGDGTRAPDPPAYRSGVLVVDGVEISTSDGHYLAVGLPGPAPYPLGGEARAVVEDVARLGGFGIAAHPDSPKDELRWKSWDTPFDGLEIVNLDTSWRLHAMRGSWLPRLKLFDALASYPIRPVETIAELAGATSEILERWSQVTKIRRVVAVPGTDAHARLALVDVDPRTNRFTLPLPGYQPALAAVSLYVKPDQVFSGNAAADAAALMNGLRAGHAFIVVDGLATPASFEFTAANAAGVAQQGDELPDAGPIRLNVRSNAPSSFTASIWRDNTLLGAGHREPEFELDVPAGPAVYRVEIRATDRPSAPVWLMSNPIYVRAPQRGQSPGSDARLEGSRPLFEGRDIDMWRVERAGLPTSPQGSISLSRTRELEFQFTPAAGDAPTDEPVALVAVIPGGVAPADRVTLTMRSNQPRRVLVQLRTHVTGQPEEKWQRSVYVDADASVHTIRFDDLLPVGDTPHRRPTIQTVLYVLLVVENVTSEGRLWLSNAALQW